MDTEREEIYERIPWETLEKKGGDRQWVVYVVAGAVTLGALAYSFTRNQPTSPGAPAPPSMTTVATAPSAAVPAVPEQTTGGAVAVAEADLFAVDPERLIDQVAAHAEWVAVEYVAYDGSERSRETLATLLPEGMPTPQASEGTQVFVDWARATVVTQMGDLDYRVEVLVRSLASDGDSVFVRQAPRLVVVDVELAEEGLPRVTGAPAVADAPPGASQASSSLVAVPDEVAAGIDPAMGEVVGGIQAADGSWEVVVMSPGSDGVSRPVTLRP